MPEARPGQTRDRAIRQLLLQQLGERVSQCFTDDHVQYLVQKGYTDESALQNATRETLQLPPAVPQALVDKLLKGFGQSGNSVVASGFHGILLSFLSQHLLCFNPTCLVESINSAEHGQGGWTDPSILF